MTYPYKTLVTGGILSKEKTHICIDGTLLAFVIGFANEKWGYLVSFPDGATVTCACKKDADRIMKNKSDEHPVLTRHRLIYNSKEEVIKALDLKIDDIHDDLLEYFDGPPWTVIALDGKENFRKEVNLPFAYKGNRDYSVHPKYIDETIEHIKDKYKFESTTHWEGDDILGCSAEDSIMVSTDKDLLQIPGYHYNWKKKELHYVDKVHGLLNLGVQMLMGDTADNIPGIKGIGIGKASEMIEDRYRTTAWSSYEELKNKLFSFILAEMTAHLINRARKRGETLSPEEAVKLGAHWFISNLIALWILRMEEEMLDFVEIPMLHSVYENNYKISL